jgi:polysaccharide biosynthesis/export protein PslD
MTVDRRHLLLLGAALGLSACGGNAGRMPDAGYGQVRPAATQAFPDIPFADWTDAEPEYVLYPGDEIEVATPTAPELTRTLKVGPDGRVSLPLIGQVMAADRTLFELESDVSAALSSELLRPVVEVTLKQAGPLKVWVDGEVRTPGVYDMAGDIDAYQAIIQAGGFLPTARLTQVALIRRGPGGTRMMRVLDLRPRQGQIVALRRGDILFVPRSNLGELANFFTQIRNALPIGFTYSINGQYQQF